MTSKASALARCLRQGAARVNGGWKDAAPALILLAVGLFALLVASIMPSGSNNRYTVVAPPWYNSGRTVSLIQAANGQIADLGGRDHVIVAYSKDPSFVRELYQAGAWLVIEPIGRAGCAGLKTASIEGSGNGLRL